MPKTVVTRARRSAAEAARPLSDRGAAAVEFALILPVLVMILLGTITAGVTYSRGIALTNAVREGARFAATGNTSAGTYSSDVVGKVRGTQYDDSATAATSSTAVCVQVWTYTTPGSNAGSGTASCPAAGAAAPSLTMPGKDTYPAVPALSASGTAGTCVVRVLAARKFSITLGIFPSLDGTLTRGAVARYERATC